MGQHIPVLLKEAIDLLAIKDGGTYVDLTLGRAGHSSEILKKIPHGRLIAFDQDQTAIDSSAEKLAGIGRNFTLIRSNFAFVKEELGKRGITSVDGILADLGVSSPQFDEAERGFSYQMEGPLDMRMDQDSHLTAEMVVNSYSLDRLAKILWDYGEEKDAYRIAKKIVERRTDKPFKTTFDLVEAVKAAKTQKELSKKGHPAKQTFQAIRMEVNAETKTLETMLAVAPTLLNHGGRLAIITFMSLDDRLVKNAFSSLTKIEGSRHGLEAYALEVKEADYISLTKKPIIPTEEEISANRRATSAKLRGIERK